MSFLLQETSDKLQQETADNILLDESVTTRSIATNRSVATNREYATNRSLSTNRTLVT